MRHFKLYVANLGKETFSRNTIRKAASYLVCLPNEYYDTLSTSC